MRTDTYDSRMTGMPRKVLTVEPTSCSMWLDTTWRRAHLWFCEGLVAGLGLEVCSVIVLMSGDLGEQILQAVREVSFIPHGRETAECEGLPQPT